MKYVNEEFDQSIDFLSPKMKSVKNCQLHLIPPEYICIFLTIVYLLVKLFLQLLNLLSKNNKQEWILLNKKIRDFKILNFFFFQLVNSMFFIYYDNLVSLLNSIITIKFKFFNVTQFFIIILRGYMILFPLYYLIFLDKWNAKLEELKEIKLKKELKSEKKIIKKSVSFVIEHGQSLICEETKIYKFDEDNNILSLLTKFENICKN